MRIGSLFSGAGGLDMAVEEVFGGEVIWQAEVDKAASKVLAYRFPCAPNLGDITQIDWKAVETPDVLCGGFPCQDVSAAGKRAGIKDGTRSGLWSVFADAIDQLRPPLVVIENVRGLLSAQAHRNVEPDEGTMGDRSDRPVLRALGAVLGDLADLGYDAQWATVAASDIGAPHRRERVFILAHSEGARRGVWDTAHVGSADREINASTDDRRITGDSSSDVRNEGRPDYSSSRKDDGVALLPTPNADVGRGVRSPEGIAKRVAKGDKQFSLEDAVALLPTPQAFDRVDHVRSPEKVADTDGGCRNLREVVINELPADAELLSTPQSRDYKGRPADGFNQANLCRDVAITDQWGKYEPAIRRWECLTRPAPEPTEPNKNNNPRLAAPFSEWLMGWPHYWVTDPDIGISRNDQLKIVGNGVCPQQAAAALRYLLNVAEAVA